MSHSSRTSRPPIGGSNTSTAYRTAPCDWTSAFRSKKAIASRSSTENYPNASRTPRWWRRHNRFQRHAPDRWFDKAARAGLGQELELLAITKALAALDRLPGECSLSVNCSPELILSGQLSPVLAPLSDLSRVVLEVTEHAAVHDYGALAEALAPYRQHSARLAVDDAGAGYSSMRHILNLAPEIIKLDMSITHCIDSDDKRRALARGLTSFAHEIGSLVIAEGVETLSEFEQLQRLSIDCAQGYLLSKPLELAAAAGFGNSA